MSTSPVLGRKELEELIIENVPRDALMACEDAYFDGDTKGRQNAVAFASGHRPSAAGHVKHFFTNETFHDAFTAHGAEPTPVRGTKLVIGRFGIFNVARLNVPGHKWVDLKRSSTRKRLAELNATIEDKFVQGDLFSAHKSVAEGTIFICGVMDGRDENGLAQLTQVMIALPSPDMKSWLYIQPLTEFMRCYDRHIQSQQPDTAVPKLKTQPKKQTGNDQGN